MAVLFPTTSILDTFDRADGALGDDWAGGSGGLTISSNQATATSDFAYWAPDEFDAHSECFATIADPGSSGSSVNRSLSLWVRGSEFTEANNPNGYLCRVSWFRLSNGRVFTESITVALSKLVAGDQIELASTSTTIPAGVKFGIRAAGSTISAWRNAGSGWTQVLSVSDTSVTTGGRIAMTVSGFKVDDFGGGNLPTAGPPTTPSALSAGFSGSRIHVAWLGNSEFDLDGYRLYRSDNGGDYALLAELDSPGYFDADIEDGHTYSYKVSAFDTEDNESALSDPVTPVAAQPSAVFTPRPPAQWTWMLADHNGANLCELVTAHGKTIRYQRNSYAEASCVISYEDVAGAKLWAALKRGQPRLKCYRNGVIRFNGWVAPFTADFEEAATINLVARSPFAQLLGEGESRGRYTKNYIAASSRDAGAIAADLLNLYAGAGTVGASTVFTDADGAVLVASSGYIGLDVGDIETTVTRDREYRYENVGEAIVNLTTPDLGFDFYEDYTDDGLHMADFVVVARQGEDREGVRFEYGESTRRNVRSVTETLEPPINVVRVFGAYNMVAEATNTTSVGTYGEHWHQATFSDVFTQDGLDAKAEALLRPFPVVTLSWVPEYGRASPRFFDDFGLGDSVRFFGRRGAWERTATARLNEAVVVVDENGYESADIPDPLAPEAERVLRAQLTVEVVV